MFKLYARLGDGEFIYVASRNDLQQALQLAETLNASWPREYVVRDLQGNSVSFPEGRPVEHEHRASSPIN